MHGLESPKQKDDSVKTSKFSEEQIIQILRQAEQADARMVRKLHPSLA